MCVCVRACVRACVRVCVCVCTRARACSEHYSCVCGCMSVEEAGAGEKGRECESEIFTYLYVLLFLNVPS